MTLEETFPELNGNQLKLLRRMIKNARLGELRELRDKFFFDETAPSLGPLWSMAVSADVKAIHRVIDERIMEVEEDANVY